MEENTEQKLYDINVKISDNVSITLQIPATLWAYELAEFTEVVQNMAKHAPNTKYEKKQAEPESQEEEEVNRVGEWSKHEDKIIFDMWDSNKTKSRNFHDISERLNRSPTQTMQHVYYWKREKPKKYKKLTGTKA